MFKLLNVLSNLILLPEVKSLPPTIASKKGKIFLKGKNSPNGTNIILLNFWILFFSNKINVLKNFEFS